MNYGPIFAEYNLGQDGAKYMIRKGEYKYTYWVHDIEELYDLSTDPEERHNLAIHPEHQPKVKQLREELFSWHRPAESSLRGAVPE